MTPALKRSRDCVESLFGQVDIALCHGDLFLRGFQIEQRGANIGVNLRAQILQALAALFETRVGLKHVAVNFAALKNRNGQRSANVKDAVRRKLVNGPGKP